MSIQVPTVRLLSGLWLNESKEKALQHTEPVNGNGNKNGILRRWIEFVVNRPKRVLLGAFAAVLIFGAIAGAVYGEFADSFTLPGAESQQAYDLLEERFQRSGSAATLVFRTDSPDGIAGADKQAEIEALLAEVATLPHVVSVDSPYDHEQQISTDGQIAYATVNYDELSNEIPISDAEKLVEVADAASSDTLQVEAGGEIVALTEQEFGGTAELIGIGAAIIILLIAFGSVVAMGVPILTALLGLALGFLGIGVVANFMDIATFAPAFASMIGIGVGIDYALFIVTRYREGLAGGLDPKEATTRALDTSGRAVLFAGVVVVISMLGLSVVGIPFVTALGIAAAIVVGSAVLVAFVFLPAFLVLIGTRIDKWSVHRPRSTRAGGRSLRAAAQQSHPGTSWPLCAGGDCPVAGARYSASGYRPWLPGCQHQPGRLPHAPGIRLADGRIWRGI